jgi:hypothetical protein
VLSFLLVGKIQFMYYLFFLSVKSRSAAIWKMVSSCLLWCVWNEKNNRYFDDLERSLEDIFSSFFFFLFFFFFHTLYIWTVAFVSPLSLSFGDFFVRFSLSSYVFSLVYFWCTYERLTLLIRPVYYLSQKKKKNNSCTHMGTGLNLYGGDAIQSKDHWLISCITCLENNCISFGANYLLRTPEIKMQPYPLIRIQPARRINIV